MSLPKHCVIPHTRIGPPPSSFDGCEGRCKGSKLVDWWTDVMKVSPRPRCNFGGLE